MTQKASEPTSEPAVPVVCPQCGSSEVKGPDHPGAALGYWRCLKCGVVWNPDRPPPKDMPRSGDVPKRREKHSDYWKDKHLY